MASTRAMEAVHVPEWHSCLSSRGRRRYSRLPCNWINHFFAIAYVSPTATDSHGTPVALPTGRSRPESRASNSDNEPRATGSRRRKEMLPSRVMNRSVVLHPFPEMEQWLSDVFGEGFTGARENMTIVPRGDVLETEDSFVIELELPGVVTKDLKIEFANNVLSISGEKRSERASELKGYHRMERSYGSFHRSFTIPSSVDANHISASSTDGVLRVSLPKREESKA